MLGLFHPEAGGHIRRGFGDTVDNGLSTVVDVEVEKPRNPSVRMIGA